MQQGLIRVLVVDDRSTVRRGLCAYFDTEPDIEVVGEADGGAEAVELARSLEPHVILMDLLMPDVDGVQATAKILADNPGARILVLTSFGSDDRLLAAIRAGVAGCLLKDGGPEELVEAVKRIACGGSVVAPAIAHRVLPEITPESRPAVTKLSVEDRRVTRLLAVGLCDREIGQRLGITAAAAGELVASIMDRLGLRGRAEAMLIEAAQVPETALETEL